ncbi:MAG: DUF6672 family protein [Sphaerochaetaceae bacterium]
MIKRRLIQLAVVVLVILLGVIMFIVGKEHTILLDNKSVEIDGTTYNAFQIVEVQVAKGETLELGPRDRDKAVVMGQRHKLTVTYTDRNFEEHVIVKKFSVPIGESMVLISLPVFAAGLDQSLWLEHYEPPTILSLSPVEEELVVTEELIPLDI